MIRIADMTNVWENVISHLEGLGYDRKLQIIPDLYDYIHGCCPGALVVSDTAIDDAYDQGKEDWFYAGIERGNNEGFYAGYEEGFEKGHAAGQARGYAEGLDEGAKKGFAEGYDLGRDMGYRSGYEEGFDYGVCK